MENEENEEEEELSDEYDEDQLADRPPTQRSSKSPTRVGDTSTSQPSRQPSPMKSVQGNPG